jgi:hypothetical protein
LDENETWQIEAIDPRDLASLVRAAIKERLDRGQYAAVLAQELETRQDVLSRLGLAR